jgi:hypothetical protein
VATALQRTIAKSLTPWRDSNPGSSALYDHYAAQPQGLEIVCSHLLHLACFLASSIRLLVSYYSVKSVALCNVLCTYVMHIYKERHLLTNLLYKKKDTDQSSILLCRTHSFPATEWPDWANFRPHFRQGCQIFLGALYQNGEKIPNYHKIHQMSITYTHQMAVIPASSIAKPSKI